MKNVIIAGGNGFLGKQFADFLINKKGYNVHIIDLKKNSGKKKKSFQYKCDVLNEKSFSKYIKVIKKNLKQ